MLSEYGNGRFALQHFEHGNTVELRNGIMFGFYPRLSHMYLYVCIVIKYVKVIILCTTLCLLCLWQSSVLPSPSLLFLLPFPLFSPFLPFFFLIFLFASHSHLSFILFSSSLYFSSHSPFSCEQIALASVEKSNIVLPLITNTLQSLELILHIAIRVVSKVEKSTLTLSHECVFTLDNS